MATTSAPRCRTHNVCRTDHCAPPRHRQIIPSFAKALQHRTVVVTNGLQLRDLCHERGVNMRKLGLLRSSIKRDDRLRALILTDMIARFSKVALRNIMRRAVFRRTGGGTAGTAPDASSMDSAA